MTSVILDSKNHTQKNIARRTTLEAHNHISKFLHNSTLTNHRRVCPCTSKTTSNTTNLNKRWLQQTVGVPLFCPSRTSISGVKKKEKKEITVPTLQKNTLLNASPLVGAKEHCTPKQPDSDFIFPTEEKIYIYFRLWVLFNRVGQV